LDVFTANLWTEIINLEIFLVDIMVSNFMPIEHDKKYSAKEYT